MKQAIPVRDDVIYLGNEVSAVDPLMGDDPPPPLGSPARDTPPLEIKDPPTWEPPPWITPQPSEREAFNDGSADA